MKWAPLVAGGALGLVLVVMATAHPPGATMTTLALDVAGVDTLEVVSPTRAEITIGTGDAVARYAADEKARVTATRHGSRLVVTSSRENYNRIEVNVPTTVRTFVVREADISTASVREPVRVLVKTAVEWSGNAGRVDIVDTNPRRTCGKECTSLTVYIPSGQIGTLHVRSADGDVGLQQPDDIGTVELDIGEGKLSLDNATRVDNIHVLGPAADSPPTSEVHVVDDVPKVDR